MNRLAEQITAELQALVGQALSDGWRVSNMQIFEFRPAVECLNRNGKKLPRADLNVHLQCRWRIGDGERVLFGSDDLLRPPDAGMASNDFDWVHNVPALDVAQQDWFDAYRAAPLQVVSASGDRYGGFCLTLEQNVILEAFPCHSARGDDSEHWRLMGHRADDSHFVVTGDGVEPFDPDTLSDE